MWPLIKNNAPLRFNILKITAHKRVVQWKFIKFQSCFKIVSRLQNLAQMHGERIFLKKLLLNYQYVLFIL